ncbi:MAG: hypothetical protein Q7R66_18050, partial [Undibacterium sp.]|uniref:hypothetical protein n=1 Tax=Undibacterium sp. TaxID=1914977 RepID=UPI00272796FA
IFILPIQTRELLCLAVLSFFLPPLFSGRRTIANLALPWQAFCFKSFKQLFQPPPLYHPV